MTSITRPPTIRALTFDMGGTLVDWHRGMTAACRRVADARGIEADWPTFVNAYRRRTLQRIKGQVRPDFNFADVLRDELDVMTSEPRYAALTDNDRRAILEAWFRLDAWPDLRPALERLRSRYVLAPFTVLSTRLAVELSRHNDLRWDLILSCEMIATYKTDAVAYRTAARWLDLPPQEILMVACHNFDLDAARASGYATAFVRRPDEWGPGGPPDPEPNPACDFVVDTFGELAERLGV